MAKNELCKTLNMALKDEKDAPSIYYKMVRMGVNQPKMASIIKDEIRHAMVLNKLMTQYKCSRKGRN